MFPTLEDIEAYFDSLEQFVISSTPEMVAVADAVDRLRDAAGRLWVGPGPPNIPGLGNFSIPALPPPPPPPPKSWMEESADWAGRHPYLVSGAAVGLVGVGLLAGYHRANARLARTRKGRVTVASKDRREVVVVLGGDTPLGLALCQDLEKKGFIVIASVAAPDEIETLESKCNGYVKALVFDPSRPASATFFLRSLTSTLSRRFPLNTPGDPYASPASLPYIQSVICLITLPSSGLTSIPTPAPLEQISLQGSYIPYLTETHIAPLQVLQGLLPLLRTNSARTRDAQGWRSQASRKKRVIVCLPATDARIGLPFASVQAMSAAATARGVEVLRRELNLATSASWHSSLRHIEILTVDIGSMRHHGSTSASISDAYSSTEDWTPAQKHAYGEAFTSMTSLSVHGRKPTELNVVVSSLINVIVEPRRAEGRSPVLEGLLLLADKFGRFLRGNRLSIGAGAGTYALASHLPIRVVDALLAIPHLVIGIRNSLLLPPAGTAAAYPPTELSESEDRQTDEPGPAVATFSPGFAVTSTAFEATNGWRGEETESHAGSEPTTASPIDDSWVSLHERE